MYDTLVIGAGPAGNHVAEKLAARNYRVAVVEEHGAVGKSTCCTGILGAECFSRFGLSQKSVIRQASSAKFISPAGKVVRLHRNAVQAHIVDRDVFDRDLAARAQDAGADYILGTRVERIAADRSEVSLECSNGRAKTLTAKSVVIATGFGSRLPEKLGLGAVEDFIAGVQAEVEAPGLDEIEVYFGQGIAPGFFAWLVPTRDGKALAGLFSRNDTAAHLRSLLRRLHEMGRVGSADVEFAGGAIPLKPLPRTYRDRVLVVGDAAGHVKPTSGGGVYYGLIGADIAADVLHRGLSEDNLSAGVLCEYERAWSRAMLSELRIGYFARVLYSRLNDRQIDRVFDIVQSNRLHELLLREDASDFDWHGAVILKGLAHGAMRATVKAFRNSLPFLADSGGC